MNLGGRDGSDNQFQIAPMLDIVFILLVFFVAAYAVIQEEKQLDIQLPKAQSGAPERRNLLDVMVNLNDKGECFVNRQKVSLEVLERRLNRLSEFARMPGATGEPGVIIRADGKCEHRYVVQIMDLCARAKIRRVFFSSLTEEQ